MLDHDLPDGVGTVVAAVVHGLQPNLPVLMHTSRDLAELPLGVTALARKQHGISAALDRIDQLVAV